MSDSLKRIYNAFDPAPLHKGQQDLYIDLDDVRGHSGIVSHLKTKILLANGPSCQVLTGHRGSGKSTELWQLRQALENAASGADRMFVVQVQADDELDRNDIDFPDILIAIIRQIASQLRERVEIRLKPGYFKDRWKRLKDLAFSEVSLDSLELEVGMAKITSTIRSSPESRRKVREALEPDTDNWLTAANDIIGQAVQELNGKGFRGLVVIVDDLDKMITRLNKDAGCLTTEHLFIHRSAQLTAFKCHVIYTLPIELAYSDHGANIRRLYGGHLPVVPMTKIETPPPNGKPYAAGIKKFREMISARLNSVGATDEDLFHSDKVRDDLIKLTGGQPTELMGSIREALVTDGLPITTQGLRRCRSELMRGYRRQLRADHWPLIEEARRTGQIVRTEGNEKAFRELLDSSALLLYRNDEEWYGVNPAIDGLEPPAPSPAVPS
jgi:energy-coupling factor transporter ATP-binding protein EcfA2